MNRYLTNHIKEQQVKERIYNLHKSCAISDSDLNIIIDALDELERYEKLLGYSESIPVDKFIFIEDGSIDTDEIEDLKFRNPSIKVVIYRQGSRPPEIQKV